MGKKLNFIEGIEGYLGKPENCEMLIILREHGGEEKPAEDFWFHKVVDEEAKNGGSKYYNVLGILAKKIIGSKDEQEALKKCAFINLAPFWGGKKCNDNKENTGRFSGKGCVFYWFKKTALQDKEQIELNQIGLNKDSNARDIAEQRLYLINQAIKSKEIKYILTVREIYDAICEKYKSSKSVSISKIGSGSFEFTVGKRKPEFMCCKINNTKIYSFYHPSYAGIGYDNLESINIPKD